MDLLADHTPASAIMPLSPHVGLADLEAHAAQARETRVYPHGYSLRVAIAPEVAAEALQRLGWGRTTRSWSRCRLTKGGIERWTIKGSTFVTQRRPRRRTGPLPGLNRTWKTRIYSLQISRHSTPREGWFLDIQGVRRSDVGRLMGLIMGLSPNQWWIAHHRAAEFFFVLPPVEALPLAERLGGVPHQGKGRLARKFFLLESMPIPFELKGKRQKLSRTATLSIYRVRLGATAAYKVELRYAGRTRDRSHFAEADIQRLHAMTEALIAEHSVRAIRKPERWEPREPSSMRRDELLSRLPAAAYRGTVMSQAQRDTVGSCHTLGVGFFAGFQVDPAACGSRTRISNSFAAQRTGTPPARACSGPSSLSRPGSSCAEAYACSRLNASMCCSASSVPGAACLSPRSQSCPFVLPRHERRLLHALCDDILGYTCLLSEVLLGVNESPMPFVWTLLDRHPGVGPRLPS